MQESGVQPLGGEESLEEEKTALQYSSWEEDPMDRGAWEDTVYGVTGEPDTTEALRPRFPGLKYRASLVWAVDFQRGLESDTRNSAPLRAPPTSC